MSLPVSMLAALMTASTRDRWSSSAISIRPLNSVNRPCTLEIPRCCATAPTEECAGSSDQAPGGGSSTPPWRASTTVPASTRPLAVTRAVDAAGAYPTAVTITVYAPAGSRASVRTAPSSSAAARSTWVPVMSVTVTTACWTAQPSRVRTCARSPIPFLSLLHDSMSRAPGRGRQAVPCLPSPPPGPISTGGSLSARSAVHQGAVLLDHSPGWASSMSWPSTPRPATVSAPATGG